MTNLKETECQNEWIDFPFNHKQPCKKMMLSTYYVISTVIRLGTEQQVRQSPTLVYTDLKTVQCCNI